MKKLSPAQTRNLLILLSSIALYVALGERAMASTLDHTLLAPVAVIGLAAVAAGAWGRRALGIRPAIEAAAFDALAPTLLALSLIHLANAWLDQGPTTEKQGVVRTTRSTRRGPTRRSVDLLEGGRVTVPASILSEGCTGGMKGFLRFRPGAFGAPWVESGRCTW